MMTRVLMVAVAVLLAFAARAGEFPAPQEGAYVAKDFRFHTGETLPEVKLAYRTLGSPANEPVVVLHGTAGSSASMLTPAFAGELFGPGQPLDAAKYFVIIPDTVGHGKSSKPSDGLRTRFPKYDYEDMVEAHHRLLTEHFKLKHVRLVIGNSMGGMETWIYAVKHPDFMDVAVPMACLPTEMSSRNWMLRRLITDSIRNDPDWKGGDYTEQPRSARFASVFFGIATNGGNQAYYKAADPRESRRAPRRAVECAIPRGCERRAVPVGLFPRLQPVAGPGEDPCHGARDQRGRRRAQSDRAGPAGGEPEAREERPTAGDPREPRDLRPRHHRLGQMVFEGAGRADAVGAAPGTLKSKRRGIPA
jgi:pimeloyl-ACP methyl ester carboxylesterase